MFTTTFLDKITGIFTGGMLLSGGLPALIVLGYGFLIASRLSDWPLAQLWQDKPTLITVLVVLGVAALALLIHSLNPLFKRWLCGDAPWIPEAMRVWRVRQRERLEARLTAALERLSAWEQAVAPLTQALVDARAAYPPAAAPAAAATPVAVARREVQAIVMRAAQFKPPRTGPIAGDLPALIQRLAPLYRQAALALDELDAAHLTLTSLFERTRTRLREAVVAGERTVRTLFPGGDVVRPTHFGNVMAAIDSYAFTRYGMDGVLLWPRLRAAQKSADAWRGVDEARPVLDFLVAATWIHVLVVFFALGAARLLWAWDPRLLAGLLLAGGLLAWVFYTAATQALMTFGLEVAAAFDLNRWALLDALHLPRAGDAEREFQLWQRVTRFVVSEPDDDERRNLWYR